MGVGGKARAPPSSAADACTKTANLSCLGDVGEVDFQLLEKILPHCTVEQLSHVEKSRQGRDLSPVTDELWKKFYENEFGFRGTNLAIESMKGEGKVTFRWKELYEKKLKEVNDKENKVAAMLRRRYQEEAARKQSRQVCICTKVPLPPSSRSNQRSSSGIGNKGSGKGNLIMNKARKDFVNCLEVRNLVAMKKTATQKKIYGAPPVTKPKPKPKPTGFSGKHSASSCSQQIKPTERAFNCLPAAL